MDAKLKCLDPKTIIGVLLDVSGSMQGQLGLEQESEKADSAINSIAEIIKEESKSNSESELFVGAFGLKDQRKPMDILEAVLHLESSIQEGIVNERNRIKAEVDKLNRDRQKKFDNQKQQEENRSREELNGKESTEQQCEKILSIIRDNGAAYIDGYISAEEAMPYLKYFEADCLIDAMMRERHKVREFCRDLPEFVRDKTETEQKIGLVGFAAAGTLVVATGGFAVPAIVAGMGMFGLPVAKNVAREKARRATPDEIDHHSQRLREMFGDKVHETIEREVNLDLQRYLQYNRVEEQPYPTFESMKSVITEKTTKEFCTRPLRKHKIASVSKQLENGNFAGVFKKNRNKFDNFFWGGTPLLDALSQAEKLFSESGEMQKFLLIISDGEPSGYHDDCLARIEQMKSSDVRVSSIFLTDQHHIEDARRFYSEPQRRWGRGARFMFNMSSMIDNNRMPRNLVAARGWKLPTTAQCKLFIQANHPEILEEASVLFTRAGIRVDSIVNVIGDIDLDILFSGDVEAFENGPRPRQSEHTCYAHAVASVIYLATARIVGYKATPELVEYLKAHLYSTDFEKLKEQFDDHEKRFHDIKDIFLYVKKALIDEFGREGADTEVVLQNCLPKFRFRYRFVDEEGAKEALNAQRPVVTTFGLAKNQWSVFTNFWSTDKGSILSDQDMPAPDINSAIPMSPDYPEGHAVVLINYERDHLRFLNSWGRRWADKGFFRVDSIHSLKPSYTKYFDVYFEESDLTESEKAAWKQYVANVLKDVSSVFPYTKTLSYSCSECNESSLIDNYNGDFANATCPRCNAEIRPGEKSAENLDILKVLYVQHLQTASGAHPNTRD